MRGLGCRPRGCDFPIFSSRRRHTRLSCDWSSDVCSSDQIGRANKLKTQTQQKIITCSTPPLPPPVPAAAPAAKKPPKQFYVSLGDSYATGYQPTAQGVGKNTRHGFAYQVPG